MSIVKEKNKKNSEMYLTLSSAAQPLGSTFWRGNLHIDTECNGSTSQRLLDENPLRGDLQLPTSRVRSPPSMMSSPEKKNHPSVPLTKGPLSLVMAAMSLPRTFSKFRT
ncbi:hypothetical protein AVEN_79335-1 [Araneus ventricosus]|uniref:Uncharacterized protein n=1 Tax=Araneus ventricosus TaxID=182803 RepID=A0A4Y2J248_ARAVE|nr:hypothetical protein AVEN_79335-1 [Araneus ventricosus]